MKKKKTLSFFLAIVMILGTISIPAVATEEIELGEIIELVEESDLAEVTEPAEDEVELCGEDEVELLAATEFYVSCDYNSETEGYGTTKFSNYAGAYAYAVANGKTNATIVVEKTNTLSGNTFDNNHKNYSRLAVVIKDGATMGNALSKWDMTYPVTVEAGGTLTCARPKSASVSNIHIKNTLTIGTEGSDKKAYCNLLSDTYQDCDISIRYNSKVVLHNAVMEIQDLDAQGTFTATDSDITVDGAFASATFFATTLNDSNMNVKGIQITGGLSDFAGGDSNQLGKVMLNGDSSINFEGGNVKVVSNVTVNGTSSIEADELTINKGKTLTVNGESSVSAATLTNNGTIAAASGATVSAETVSEESTGKVTIDGEEAVFDGSGNAVAPVCKIGDKGYSSVEAALKAAKDAGMTDVTITLVGNSTTSATTDSFFLYTEKQFDSVTFTQEDVSTPYYLDGIYTGSRTNNGTFVFDGVNIIVNQYIFEGNVKLTNNSVIKSATDSNCFHYYSNTTVEPGSKLQGIIDETRGGKLVLDGGKTDGTYNETPDMQDSILKISWSGDSITLKNGAFLKVNAANEVGRLTVSANTSLNVYDSMVDTVQWIDVSGTLNTDTESFIKTKKITGAGKIVIDASAFDGADAAVISADMTGFTGTIEMTGNENVVLEKTATGVNVKNPAAINAYVAQDTVVSGWTTIWGQLTINGTESFCVDIYSGDTYLGKTSLVDTEKAILNGNNKDITWHAFVNGSDSWWNTEWEIKPDAELVPTNVKCYVDGDIFAVGAVQMNSPDDLNKVTWGELKGVNKVKVGDAKYDTLEKAVEAAKAGDTITLLANITLDSTVTLPADITFNGNGKEINGTIYAGGNLTFEGYTKIKTFSASYYNRVITIGEGATLEITGTGRVSLAYGNTFNITGTISDAKIADKEDITPSLIIPGGISITGGNDAAMNVKNAYVKIGSTSSKPSEANGEFTLNFENSIVDFTNQLTFSVPESGKNPTFNVSIKDSVLTTGTKLVAGAPNSNVVIDNSIVTLGNYIRNSGELTLKNGSVLTGATIQFGENGGNDGKIYVDDSSLTVVATSTGHAFDGKAAGSITLTNGAAANVDYVTDMAINVDATSKFTTKQLLGTSTIAVDTEGIVRDSKAVTVFEQTKENAASVEAITTVAETPLLTKDFADGDIKLTADPLTVKIGGEYFSTLDKALDYAKEQGMTELEIEVLADVKYSGKIANFKKITFKGTDREQTFDMNVGSPIEIGTELVFEDLTVSRLDGEWLYHWTYIKGGLTYNNCKMIGLFNVTAQDTDFIGCDFYNDDSFGNGSYSIWLYNCYKDIDVNITDCTFDVYERAIKIYGDGYKDTMTLNISGTEFVSRTADKTVVEMAYANSTGLGKIYLYIDDSTAEGFGAPEHIDGEENAWFNVEGAKTCSTVIVDGELVYTDAYAEINGEYCMTLQDAITLAEDGDTICVVKDLVEEELTLNKKLTIDLQGNTLKLSDTASFYMFAADGGYVISDDVTFTNGTIDLSGAVTDNDGIFNISADTDAKLTLKDIKLVGKNVTAKHIVHMYYEDDVRLVLDNVDAIIDGHTKADSKYFVMSTLNSGTETSYPAVVIKNSDITIKNGNGLFNSVKLDIDNSVFDLTGMNNHIFRQVMGKINDTLVTAEIARSGEQFIKNTNGETLTFSGKTILNNVSDAAVTTSGKFAVEGFRFDFDITGSEYEIADGYKAITQDVKGETYWYVVPDFTVEAIADVDEAVAGDKITVVVKVTKGGAYTNASWILKYDPRYVTYDGTDAKNYKIEGAKYDGDTDDGIDEFDANTELGKYTFTVNADVLPGTAVFEIVSAEVHTYAMAAEFDGVPATPENDNVIIGLKDGVGELDGLSVPYNGMEQRGAEVTGAPAGATITYSAFDDFRDAASIPPAFINVGEHTYYAKIEADGYATKTVEQKLIITAIEVNPTVEWSVAPESDHVGYKPVISGVVDGTFTGKVTVMNGSTVLKTFDASEFAYDGHGRAVYTGDEEVITGVTSGTLTLTIKYEAGADDNYKTSEGTKSTNVDKSTIDEATEELLEKAIKGNGDVVYDGTTHYVDFDASLLPDGWSATVAAHSGVKVVGDINVVDVTFTDDTGKYNDYTATVIIKTVRRDITIYVNNATKKNGQPDSEAENWGYTAVVHNGTGAAIIGSDLGDIKIVRVEGYTDEIEGTYYITATYTPNNNYVVKVEDGTLTIFDAVIKIEVVDNTKNKNAALDTEADYTVGTRMILVHTDADHAYFTYNGKRMYDVTDAGYEYFEHDYATGTHAEGKVYQHVYAIVVDAEYGYVATNENRDLYVRGIKYAGKDDTASYAPIKITYNADINEKDELHTNDYSMVKGVYNSIYDYDEYQINILKADFDKNKIVNTADAQDVKDIVIE